jgi:hypothetical protein
MAGRFLALCLWLTQVSHAHEFFSTKITWSREISRIFVKSCAGCHREGGAAFPMTTFAEARPWATAIKEEVLARRMPPWGAAKGFGDFEPDGGLSQDEISLIADWAEGGAPEGEKSYLPKIPSPGNPPRVTKSTGKWREQPIRFGSELSAGVFVAGIAPRGMVTAGSQVVAQLPDGSTDPVIWILNPIAAVQREFFFREPRLYPKGTRFTVSTSGGQWKMLVSSPPQK